MSLREKVSRKLASVGQGFNFKKVITPYILLLVIDEIEKDLDAKLQARDKTLDSKLEELKNLICEHASDVSMHNYREGDY